VFKFVGLQQDSNDIGKLDYAVEPFGGGSVHWNAVFVRQCDMNRVPRQLEQPDIGDLLSGD